MILNAKTAEVRTLEIAAVAAVLLAFGYFALNWGLEGVIHSRRTQTVPDLKSRSTGMGLRIMNYRASLIGGTLEIKGTVSAMLISGPPATPRGGASSDPSAIRILRSVVPTFYR